MTDLLALTSPDGIALLIVTFVGIALFIRLGLRGIGIRDLPKAFRFILRHNHK